jgi:hypothetical protein
MFGDLCGTYKQKRLYGVLFVLNFFRWSLKGKAITSALFKRLVFESVTFLFAHKFSSLVKMKQAKKKDIIRFAHKTRKKKLSQASEDGARVA